ncbi:sushi domain-containing protein 3 [Echinops telfairi]|uniref:Sushi domain-containing protein 3 n=1 Tax=Echinops telfairi TaxID=9371 RepID=A0AC55DFF8_ECHTE|nr:sushi domain-containing protein 3 [Echinops telfairi]
MRSSFRRRPKPAGPSRAATPAPRNRTGTCSQLKPSLQGTFQVLRGNGTSLGTVLLFHCPSGHQMGGPGLITCAWKGNVADWSSGIPVCKSVPPYETFGFRVAVIASIISCAIILLMAMAFLTCCLMKCVKREEQHRSDRTVQLWYQLRVGDLETVQAAYLSLKGLNNNNNIHPRSQSCLGEAATQAYDNRCFTIDYGEGTRRLTGMGCSLDKDPRIPAPSALSPRTPHTQVMVHRENAAQILLASEAILETPGQVAANVPESPRSGNQFLPTQNTMET